MQGADPFYDGMICFHQGGGHHPCRERPGHCHGWSQDSRHQEIPSAAVDSWPQESRHKLIIQDLTRMALPYVRFQLRSASNPGVNSIP